MRVGELFLSERGITRSDLIAIVAHTLSLTRERVLADPDRRLAEAEELMIRRLTQERRKGMPLAYITGEREFFSQVFFVDERVLIPRPETELLVERALALAAGREAWAIVDMGTGSGAIGLLLAQRLGRSVTCVDVSLPALRVARSNAERMGIGAQALFVCSDLFSGLRRGMRFGLVTANLPYVAAAEWDSLMLDVRAFEPRGALWGGEDGLDVYRRFLRQLARRKAYLQEEALFFRHSTPKPTVHEGGKCQS